MFIPKYHYMFPSLILEKNDPDSAAVKSAVESGIFNHITEDGWTGEWTGFVTLHLDPAFDALFRFAGIAIKDYIARFEVDPNDFEFYIVKSWANIIENRSIPPHHHADAHLSFVYYVNMPESITTPIMFHNHVNRHEPFPGFSTWNSKRWDMLNSGSWRFAPTEGTVMVFPGTMKHECPSPKTIQDGDDVGVKTLDALRRHRVSIAGDVIITYKENSDKPLGLQPVKNWRML